MFVLKRSVGEEIHIGDDIVLRILDIKGGSVRIGLEAPVSVKILRGELVKKDNDGQVKSGSGSASQGGMEPVA